MSGQVPQLVRKVAWEEPLLLRARRRSLARFGRGRAGSEEFPDPSEGLVRGLLGPAEGAPLCPPAATPTGPGPGPRQHRGRLRPGARFVAHRSYQIGNDGRLRPPRSSTCTNAGDLFRLPVADPRRTRVPRRQPGAPTRWTAPWAAYVCAYQARSKSAQRSSSTSSFRAPRGRRPASRRPPLPPVRGARHRGPAVHRARAPTPSGAWRTSWGAISAASCPGCTPSYRSSTGSEK